MSPDELNEAILYHHARSNAYQLAGLYQKASDLKRGTGDNDAAAFLLTQAYVFALESGHRDAKKMRAQLARDGRELNE